MNRKATTKMSSTGGTMFRAPSYFVWNQRGKHATSSPRRPTQYSAAANTNMNNTQDQDGTVDDSGPSPRKMRSPRRRVTGADNQSTDTKSSVVSGDSTLVTISPKHKDPDRIKKDREREERVRQARERLEEERKRKLVDLQEQQRQAQANREKQLEMRRKKIEDLRRRDVERRAEVEKRRRDKENAERSRRETLLIKAEERVARYEAWKRGGQKGGRSHVLGFGSATPRHACLPYERPRRSASSHTALLRRSPNGSDSEYSFRPHRRALSACSTVRRHCCVDLNRTTAPSAPPPSRPKSVVTLHVSSSASSGVGVRLRENKAPRKPRPASVGTSMPSFVTLEQPRASPRSKSTDRLARERSRPRVSMATRRTDEEKKDEREKSSGGTKLSRRTLDRLSTPRQMASIMGDSKRETPPSATPKRETVARKSATRDKTPKETSTPKPQQPAAAAASASSAASASAASAAGAGSTSPSTPSSRTPSRTPVRVASPTLGADEDGGSTPQLRSSAAAAGAGVGEGKSAGDISAEEYKAKLAEKRRQAREKAEREAEEERRRQEELERQEEERRQQEEEEQRRRDEEANRLAEEARRAEEERLQRAIEAEEARKAEEAARLEQERLAREEAERKAKEEAERLELEKQEKARKDEEERQERKKRLEKIMKRVKTESPAEGAKDAFKSVTSSPSKSVNSTASSDTSPTEPDNKTVQAMAAQSDVSSQPTTQDETARPWVSASSQDSELSDREKEEGSQSPFNAPSPVPLSDRPTAVEEKSAEITETHEVTERGESVGMAPDQPSISGSPTPPPDSGVEKPKFKSPLLQKLVEGKDDAGASSAGGPRFKSPLLQNLLGKTKMRSVGSAQDQSVSDPNLVNIDTGVGKQEDRESHSPTPAGRDVMSSSMVEMGTVNTCQKEETTNKEEGETSEDSSSAPSSPCSTSGKHFSNGVSSIPASAPSHEEEEDSSAVRPEPMEISTPVDTTMAPSIMAGSSASFWGQQDSGVSLGSDDLRSIAPSGSLQASFNGHGPGRLTQSQGLEDSSISMRSVESVSASSLITDSAAGSSVFSSVTSLPPQPPAQGPTTAADHPNNKDFEEIIDLSPVNNKTSPPPSSSSSPSTLTVLDTVNFNKLEEGSGETTTTTAGPPPPIIAFEDRRQDVPDLLS